MTADITDNQTIYQVDKYFDALEKATETSLKAVMGMTFQCARCHDHKFDPILQKDYYKLTSVFQAVWDPENWLASNIRFGEWPSRMVLDMEPEKSEEWIKEVTSNGAKLYRRQQLVIAAVYDRYRKEIKAGKPLSDSDRDVIRKEIAADPDLDVDPKAPTYGITDTDLETRFPELLQMKKEAAELRKGREYEEQTQLRHGDMGCFEGAVANIHSDAGELSLSRGSRCNQVFPPFWTIPSIPSVSRMRKTQRIGITQGAA